MKTKAEIAEMDAARAGENVIWDDEAGCYIERKDDRDWFRPHKYLYAQGIPPREIRCEECGSQETMESHHKVALSKGGTNERSNVVILCKKCHCKAENRIYNPYYSILDRMAAEGISYREAKRETNRKYFQTEAGKKPRRKAQRKYRQTEAGKEVRRKYFQTEAYKEYKREYFQTEAGKKARRKAQRKYRLKQKESKAKEVIA
jgi:hypothetical protein